MSSSRRVLHAKRDVLRERRAEEKRLLRDEPDVPPQLGRRQLAQVRAVHQHRALGRVHEPRNQTDERALARAGVADDGDGRARRDAQVTPSSARPVG